METQGQKPTRFAYEYFTKLPVSIVTGWNSNAQCQIPFNIYLSISPLGVMPLCKNVAPISRPITGVITSVFQPWHPIHLLQSLIGSFDRLHVFRIVEKKRFTYL